MSGPVHRHFRIEDRRRSPGQRRCDDLADGINLGLSKMAESCPGTTYASELSWYDAFRDETYSSA
jgi:hypothetical protein